MDAAHARRKYASESSVPRDTIFVRLTFSTIKRNAKKKKKTIEEEGGFLRKRAEREPAEGVIAVRDFRGAGDFFFFFLAPAVIPPPPLGGDWLTRRRSRFLAARSHPRSVVPRLQDGPKGRGNVPVHILHRAHIQIARIHIHTYTHTPHTIVYRYCRSWALRIADSAKNRVKELQFSELLAAVTGVGTLRKGPLSGNPFG